MADYFLWLETLAGIKALFDLLGGAPDYYARLKRYREDQGIIAEAHEASATFSTYSDNELKALIEKIEGCRDRFINQGGGADRRRCLCSILNEALHGNGGYLPDIDDWLKIHAQLHCKKWMK